MKKHFNALALVATLMTSLSASAMTIDFTEFATDSSALNLTQTITSKGFTFVSAPNTKFSLWGKTNAWNANPGGAAIMNNFKATMTQASGAAFSLYSIDFDDAVSAPPGAASYSNSTQQIKFTLRYVGGGVSQKTVDMDRVGGLQTFVLAEYNLLSVDWEDANGGGTYGAWQFDNVKVNVDCATK